MKKTPLTALSLPIEKISPYPWPLIMWPIEKEAIGKLRELRQQWKKENVFFSKVLARRLERRGGSQRKYPMDPEAALALCLPKKSRGRLKGSSPLQTEQSWAIAVLIKYCGAKPVEILSALERDTSSGNPASFRWLQRRRLQGEKTLNALSPQEKKTIERKIANYLPRKAKTLLLKTLHEYPA